jgi:hypothetical protein
MNNERTNKNLSDTEIKIDSIVADTTKFLISDLPIIFDSTNYALHCIGFYDTYSRGKRYFVSENGRRDYGTNTLSISGQIANIVFENIKTEEKYLLTRNLLLICHIEYMGYIAQKTNNQYLLYELYDKDNNNDNEINTNDIKSLYISNINGKNFKKITIDNNEFLNGNFIEENMRYYFRTKDVAKKGKLHYYYIEFTNDDYSTYEYFPLELLK